MGRIFVPNTKVIFAVIIVFHIWGGLPQKGVSALIH